MMNSAENPILLDAIEVRVLGSLVEKEITTPEYYPLSLNALVNACNQTSNRDPVVAYGEQAVLQALEALRDKKLAFIFSGATSRVSKYGHKMTEALALSRAETAALCVLMLRGPQTVGEIRGRTGRIYDFATLDEVESTLQALAARNPQPLVVRLARQTGFKEPRYAHLLSGPPALETPETTVVAESAAMGNEEQIARLEQEVETLRRELAELKAQFAGFKRQFE